jgi:acetyl esterase/lipase
MRCPTRRALLTAGVLLALTGSLISCRPRPGTGTTTTRPTGPAPSGRFIDTTFEIQQLADGEVFRTAGEAPGVGSTPAKDLRLNIWGPANDTMTNRPVMIWQFGGGFQFGDRNQMNSQAQTAARRGYVGVTIDYRLTTGSQTLAGTRAAFEDAQAAVRWIQARADQYKINPEAIITGGLSAGAINSVDMVTFPATADQILVAGVVSLSGNNWGPAPKAGGPPVIMFGGDNDFLVPLDSGSPVGWSTQGARTFCNAYRAAGNTCDLHVYPGGHGAGSTDAPNIYPRFLLERVLRPLGY